MHAMSKKQAKPDTAQSNCAPTATERAPVELANKGAKALAAREARERAAVKTTNEGPEPPVAKPKYLVAAREEAALDRVTARLRDNTAPPLKVVKRDGGPQIVPDHPNLDVGLMLLAEALGCADQEFLMGLLSQLVDVCSRDGKIDELALNFMISVIKGNKPKDQVESMLAAQMAAAQMLSMRFAGRLLHSQSLQQQDSDERAFNKFSRTYTGQVHVLNLKRSSGEQTITVQNVSVSEGSQAIVGTHQTVNSTPANANARTAPMPILDAQEVRPVPSRRKSGS
jgi:hypothetical protein